MNDLQHCELCFQAVGPFYCVRILPVTSLDLCGGTATPPHARVAGEQKIACHLCRYAFSNLETCGGEVPSEPSAAVLPEPYMSIPTGIGSTSLPARSPGQSYSSQHTSARRRAYHKKAGRVMGQRAPPRYPDTRQINH